ncbi:hypothetical protein RMS29_026820 (plasmid) [Agrobacterium rosae]|uniref:Uncharacterized protein n=1 Tax=Agrobacterium rosae TaxID=1972867 RepID=A0ABU4W3T5_9HYPH|nr:hypothetical protein [Agrobacterium rosae]
MTNRYVIQTENRKSDEAVGKGIVAIFALVAALAAISFAYEKVVGWYDAAAIWLADVVQYLAGFWPL